MSSSYPAHLRNRGKVEQRTTSLTQGGAGRRRLSFGRDRATLRARKLTSHIHSKVKRGKPLTEQAKGSNRTKSTVRVRPSRACKGMHCQATVEHIFGVQANDMGGTLVQTIGLARAKAKIGMKNLAYNMRRLGQLGRLNPCPV